MAKPKSRLSDGILLLGENRESRSLSMMFATYEPATPIEITVDERIPTPVWLFQGETILGEGAIREYYDRHILTAFAGMT